MVKAKKYGPENKKDLTCRVCQRSHPLRFCPKFLSYNIEGRLRAVSLYKHCSSCLGHDHNWRKCKSEGRCRVCNEGHHTLLHSHERVGSANTRRWRRGVKRPRTSDSGTNGPSSPKGPRSSYRKNRTAGPSSSINAVTCNLSSAEVSPAVSLQPSVAILPTAVIKIVANGQIFRVRAAVDSGVPHTKIALKLVEHLGLKVTKMAQRVTCSLTIKATNGSGDELNVVARVGQAFSILNPPRTLDARIHEKFAGLILADQQFHVSSAVHLTLGMDVYARILREGLQRRGDQLVAQYSIFGFLISGMHGILRFKRPVQVQEATSIITHESKMNLIHMS